MASQCVSYCGIRYGELAALRADLLRRRLDIAESVTEVAGKAVFGSPKNHQRRSVPLPRRIVEELAVHIAGKAPDEFVFSPRAVVSCFSATGDARCSTLRLGVAGLPGLTPHELRHTAASPGGRRWGQRKGGPADAGTCIGGYDPRRLQRLV
jgi:integrase